MLRRLLVIFWRVLSTAAVLLIALFIAYFLWFYHLISTSNNGFQWTVQGRYKDFELTLEQQRFSLTHSGAVAFEFRHVTPSHYYGGCLVGGEKMYRYTTYEGTSPYIQLFGSTNPQDIAEASDLAKALVGQTFAPHHIADNLGDYV